MSAEAAGGFPVEHEEHENHERYLITYADMITLLMALFIILFAIGQTDLEKYRRFAEGASGGTGILDGTAVLAGAQPPEPEPSGVEEEVEQLAARLRDRLAGTGAAGEARVGIEDGSVVVRLPSDALRFASGSAILPPAGHAVLAALAVDLDGAPGAIVVEGHTDDQPTGGARSNWELSTDRAATVVRALVSEGIDPHRLTAAGRADTEPIASNADDVGRAANRRVELSLLDPHGVAEEPIHR